MGIVDGFEFCSPRFSSKEHKVQGIINSAYMAWSIRTKQYLAGLSTHYLLRWSPPFMA